MAGPGSVGAIPTFKSSDTGSKNSYIGAKFYAPLYNNYFVLKNVKPNPNLPSAPWETTWNGVRRALRQLVTPEDMMSEYAYWAEIDPALLLPLLKQPTNLVVPFLSALKTNLLRNTDKLPDTFRFWIDIVYLAGYPEMKDREMVDDPVQWLSVDTVSSYGSAWWEGQFRETFGESIVKTPVKLLSFEEFALRRWLWSTNGASSFSEMLLAGDKVKTKFGAAMSLSDERILELIEYDNRRDEIRIFLKPDEAGYKRRLIANVPLGAYINASYIRYLIESFTTDKPKFMKLDVLPEEAFNVTYLIETGHMAMPLDESAYDYHVSRESWLGFIAFLNSQFPDNSGVEYFSRYFASARWFNPEDSASGKWTSGMPSGLALTSFCNSWMNYIKQREVCPGELAWAAGDDVLTFPYTYQTLGQIEKKYEAFGSAVNAMKNWQSWSWGEYLKVLYFGEGSTGYPARIFGTLLWAGAQRTFLPADRLPELAELFKQFFDRLQIALTRPDVERYVASDLARSISSKVAGFGQREAIEWLHSPRAYGGFGCLPYNDVVFDWKTEILDKNEYTNVIFRLPPVIRYKTKVALNKYRKPIVNANYSTGRPLLLPEVVDLAGWEARINRDDIPIKGKYATAALDVIPLPTLNFISTKNVAAFASNWNFNVFPNLRGSVENVPSKLVNASLALAQAIGYWMSKRQMVTLC